MRTRNYLLLGLLAWSIGIPAALKAAPASSQIDASTLVQSIRDAREPSTAVDAYGKALAGGVDSLTAERTYLNRMVEFSLPEMADSQSQDLIQLNQELTFITSYVALEQMRLAHRLKVTFNVEDQVRDALVPHMILQPIVENAILHGAAASRMGGWVNIHCRRENSSLLMEVMNSAGTVAVRKSNGLGLKNTRARLQNLFEEDAALEFAMKDEIATARIVLPMITAKEAVAP